MTDISRKIKDLNEKWCIVMTIMESGLYTLNAHRELSERLEASELPDDTELEFVSRDGTFFPNKKTASKWANQLLINGKKELVANFKEEERIVNELLNDLIACKKEVEGGE
jgi:hypothetical protein